VLGARTRKGKETRRIRYWARAACRGRSASTPSRRRQEQPTQKARREARAARRVTGAWVEILICSTTGSHGGACHTRTLRAPGSGSLDSSVTPGLCISHEEKIVPMIGRLSPQAARIRRSRSGARASSCTVRRASTPTRGLAAFFFVEPA
jgi:hypothetical protein